MLRITVLLSFDDMKTNNEFFDIWLQTTGIHNPAHKDTPIDEIDKVAGTIHSAEFLDKIPTCLINEIMLIIMTNAHAE